MRAWRVLSQAPLEVRLDQQRSVAGGFILCLPRSGSTLLRMLLDSHSQIASPPETHLLPPLLELLRDEETLHALWHLGFDRPAVAEALAQSARHLLDAYAASKGKAMWIEKTPRNHEYAEEIALGFPDAKLIVLQRHPFDVVQSMIARDYAGTNDAVRRTRRPGASDFETCCRYVEAGCRRLLEFSASHPDRVFVVGYEELSASPAAILRGLCQFLGVEYEPSMLHFAAAEHDIGFGDTAVHATDTIVSRPKSYECWSQTQFRTARSRLDPVLRDLGYEAEIAGVEGERMKAKG